MKLTIKYILILSFFFSPTNLCGQITISQNPSKIDSVWYSDVTDDSEPPQLSCENNNVGYFRLQFEKEIIIEDFKSDSIQTEKEDWETKDEEEFDEKYNDKNRAELDDLANQFIEEDSDIDIICQEEIDRFVEENWNGFEYNICNPDCKSSIQDCYILQEITFLKNTSKAYSYRTSFSWLEFKDEGPNNVEVDLDLIITYSSQIYFKVYCSCDDIPGLISAKPIKLLSKNNPWSKIDLTGEFMKPGYPFAIP